MTEYIEREALLEAVASSVANNPHKDGKVRANHQYEHGHFANLILAQPAADVSPVVHAKYDSEHCCTNCGEMALKAPYPGTYYHTLHCWACNAKMDNGSGIGDIND